MASTSGRIMVFVLTMVIVFVVFYFVGKWGILDRFEDTPCLFYGIIIFAALSVTFGVNMALKDILLGEKQE